MRPWPRYDLTLALAAILLAVSGREDEGRKPHYLSAAVGESVVLNCEVDFPHDVAVPYILRWNKEGSPAFAWDGAEQVEAAGSYRGRVSRLESPGSNLGRGAVNLTSIRESDEGWYECKVFFPNRNPPTRPNGTWFHLTVEGGKLLAIPPINQTALEGESARFRCVAKQAGARVTWSRDGVPLTQMTGLWARSEVDADGSLNIIRTEHDDPGLYRCEVANAVGEKQTAGAHLNVLYKAKVVLAPAEQFLAYGRHGMLDCHFRANPALTYLRWEKDGFLFDPYNVPGVFLLHNGSLAFDHVDESHAGVYTCTPHNELGSAGASAPMTVMVQRPPVFTLRPASLYVRRVGDGVDMACAAAEEGNPEESRPPTITWIRKDGGDLPPGRHVVANGNLTLRSLRREDSGVYVCEAANEAARLVTEAELLVEEGVPRAPHSLAANSSHDAIALRWTPGARRAVHHISVWYRRADLAEWRSLRLPAGSRETVLAPLRPGSLYEVMVSSREQDGEGMLSRPLRIHTKGIATQEETENQHDAVSTNAPRNVSVQALGSSWLVTWAPPERGHNRGYTIRWRQQQRDDSGDEPDVRGVDTDDTWLLVRGLEEGATYIFEVESRGGSSSRTAIQVTGQRARSARAVVLAALVAAILLVAVAVASWHGGRVCNSKRSRTESRGPPDHADRKIYDALVSRLQPPSLADNVWVAPNTLTTTGNTTGSREYPRENYD